MSVADEVVAGFDPAFDALERGDVDGFIEVVHSLMAPDCIFRSGIGSAVGGGTYDGVEGVREWFGDLVATTSGRRWRNRRSEMHGDNIVVFLADFELTGAGSGVPVSSPTASVYELENDLVVRIRSFTSHDEARRFTESLNA
jgi:ketosteroid isomerase-like protein